MSTREKDSSSSVSPAGGAQAPPPRLDELEEAIRVAQRHTWHAYGDHGVLSCVEVLIDQMKELKAQRPYRVAAPPPHPLTPACSCWIGRVREGGWAPDRIACAVHGDAALAKAREPHALEAWIIRHRRSLESFLEDDELAELDTLLTGAPSSHPREQFLLAALAAARDVLATFGKQAGYLSEHGGYSTRMTEAEMSLARAVTDIDRILAEPGAPPPAPQWQPIKTAPKDGREVLVHDEGATFIAWWSEDDGAWMDSTGAPGHQKVEPPPQFWMPLPAPPAPQEPTK